MVVVLPVTLSTIAPKILIASKVTIKRNNQNNNRRNNNNNNNNNGQIDNPSNLDLSSLLRINGDFGHRHPVFLTPPAKGIKAKIINNIIYYWCHHCHRWQKSHGTQGHTGPKRDQTRLPAANLNTNNNTTNTNNSNTTNQSSDQPSDNTYTPGSTSSTISTKGNSVSGFLSAASRFRRNGF